VITRIYKTRHGNLTEQLRYVFSQSTLVQAKFAVTDYAAQLDSLEALLTGRGWRFVPSRLEQIQQRVGELGFVMAGELCSPLKMLHILLGPTDTTYFLTDFPERAAVMLALHEAAQLDLVGQMASAGVRIMVAMDNLNSSFHTPKYVERYSASFYEKASRICHEHGCLLLIHACGRQKNILRLIDSLGVDGLEGVTFPPLGDVELDEAMQLTGDRFIITGGISAAEFGRLQSRKEVFEYVRSLFQRMGRYSHRFVLSASCNTSYDAPWETICYFRDAWQECCGLI
jgi:uroporphyrinogen decarboxylase